MKTNALLLPLVLLVSLSACHTAPPKILRAKAVTRTAVALKPKPKATPAPVAAPTAQTALTFAWSPNVDPVAGYRVYYGQTSGGAYPQMIDAGNSTTATISDLIPGKIYYFVATAYDSTGSESTFSNQVSTPIFAISGKIIDCSRVPGYMQGFPVNLAGDLNGSTATDSNGAYSFQVPRGGSYTVTPAKPPLPIASSQINSLDAIRTMGAFLGLSDPLICPRAGDANGDGFVNSIDVIAIQRFFVAAPSPSSLVGKFLPLPVSRSYAGVLGDAPNGDFAVAVVGDVQ